MVCYFFSKMVFSFMNDNELKALISLLDDPDMIIFKEVEQKLITCGPEVIPSLEASWESSFDVLMQTRIENIIHSIQFDQIKNELQVWKMSNSFDLLNGLLIINRYQYPAMDVDNIMFQFAEMKREVWYELIYDMSPYEKVKLLNHVFFQDFGLSGNTTSYHDPQNSYLNKVLESKKGNPITLACIYCIVAQRLDIPIYGVNLPKHFVLAYMGDDELNEKPLFYINVFNKGQIMKMEDILSFLKQLNLSPANEYILPCDNVSIIKRVLRNLVASYDQLDSREKKEEIQILLDLMEMP